MKILVFILFIGTLFSQDFKNKWIDESFNIYEFRSDSLTWAFGGWSKEYEYEWTEKDSTIKIETYWASERNGKWIIKRPINLIQVDKTLNHIILRPKNKNARDNFFPIKDSINLKTFSSLIPEPIILEEFFFESSGCFGSCKPVTFFIDSTRNFHFRGGYNLKEREGYFIGKLSEQNKKELENILSEGFIQKIPPKLGRTIDAQYFTILIRRDGLYQSIKGTNIPDISWDMIHKLINFHSKVDLRRTNKFILNENLIINKGI